MQHIDRRRRLAGHDYLTCPDCGRTYDRLFRLTCPHCAEMLWAVWDAAYLADPHNDPEDRERGTYVEGLSTRAAAQAATVVIIDQMAQAGVDLTAADCVIRPYRP